MHFFYALIYFTIVSEQFITKIYENSFVTVKIIKKFKLYKINITLGENRLLSSLVA